MLDGYQHQQASRPTRGERALSAAEYEMARLSRPGWEELGEPGDDEHDEHDEHDAGERNPEEEIARDAFD